MQDEPIRLLIVDGSPVARQLYRQLLAAHEDRRYEISEADSGAAAREHCCCDRPHVVLLEYGLPDTSGLELLPQFRSDESGVPAVILTAETGSELLAVQAMRRGVDDYLPKGAIDSQSLQESITRAIQSNAARRRQIELQRSRRSTDEQLGLAGQIQNGLLPKAPPSIAGFDIAGRCVPAAETGGDFFDFVLLPDDSVHIAMGDVSGHGLGPAILASETRAYLRAFSQAYTSPGEILVLANRLLCDDMEGTRFVTLFLGRLEPKSRDVRFAAAGQRSFLLSEQGEWTTLDSGQPPLGLSENLVTGVEHQVHLPPGNLLLLLTDGIPESSPPGRKLRRRSMFGYPRVLDLVGECRDQPALEIINQLFHAVHRYTGTDREDDDMTVVLIKATE